MNAYGSVYDPLGTTHREPTAHRGDFLNNKKDRHQDKRFPEETEMTKIHLDSEMKCISDSHNQGFDLAGRIVTLCI